MEDALVLAYSYDSHQYAIVLILVLMEDALVHPKMAIVMECSRQS